MRLDTTGWAGTDFTADNGATLLVPGSLDWDDTRVAEPHEIVPAVMKRGSVLVCTGGVFHAGGENRSDRDRIGLNLTYALGGYSLGYFTPPLPPGDGPAVVGPEWMLGAGDRARGFSDVELLARITQRVTG